MKKLLIVSTLGRQFFLFEAANISALKGLGVEVHGAANLADEDKERLDAVEIVKHHVDMNRSPISLSNLRAFFQLLTLMRREQYDAVHCHAPVGGVLGRLAARLAGVPVAIYTAHGFHFYRGAPVINWILYFPVEHLLARITDAIITVNNEDCTRATRSLPAKQVWRIDGVGVDISRYMRAHNRTAKRRELGLPEEAVVFVSIGELNVGKNHELTLRSFAMVRDTSSYLLICGRGKERALLEALAWQLGVEERVQFLGYRADIPDILGASDIYISASRREGLPLSCVEAMASGLPVLCSRVRGHVDLVEDGLSGRLFDPSNANELADMMDELANSDSCRSAMGRTSLEKAQAYDLSRVESAMRSVYSRFFEPPRSSGRV